jgi:hypothetical protein
VETRPIVIISPYRTKFSGSWSEMGEKRMKFHVARSRIGGTNGSFVARARGRKNHFLRAKTRKR